MPVIYQDLVSLDFQIQEPSPYTDHLVREGKAFTVPEGYYVDWNGDIKSTAETDGTYACQVNTYGEYPTVEVLSRGHEVQYTAVYYPTLDALNAALAAEVNGGIDFGV